jgi:DNA invertase Pin-like site-specific DNA recombinase
MDMAEKPKKQRRRRPKPDLRFTSEVPWPGRGEDDPMMVGYVRVSTDEQNTQRQVDELVRAGVSPLDIFGDHASGATMDRTGWNNCLRDLRAGDILVIHSLDRLSRDLVSIMTTLKALNDRGVTVKVLTMDFDSRTPMGRFVFAMMGAFAQFERDVIMERTLHGLAKARERGRVGGAQKRYTPEAIAEAVRIEGSYEGARKRLGCSIITVKRGMAEFKAKENGE